MHFSQRRVSIFSLSIVAPVALITVLLGALAVFALPAFAVEPSEADIKEIQVVQSLGHQLNGRKEYVAGKDTVIRVILDQPVEVAAAEQKLEIIRDGSAVATLEPLASANPTATLTFACSDRKTCGDWKAGSYKLEASIDGTSNVLEGVKFVERKNLRVLAVPVKANYGGEVKAASGRWKEGGDFLRQVYPISDAGYDWIWGQALDASDERYDLTSDEGPRAIWEALADLQPKGCLANPNNDRCYDLIVGFVPDRIESETGSLQGFTYGAPANIVVEADEDMPATVAHEVAHTFGIGDEYNLPDAGYQCDINPPPPSYVGREYDGDRENYSCPNSTEVPFPIGSGTLVSAEKDQPFEVGGRGQLPDMISFMGSGAKQENNWITPKIYNHIFGQLAPGTAKSQASTTTKASRAVEVRPLIYASGFIPKDVNAKVQLDYWYSLKDEGSFVATFVPSKGAYSIAAIDKTGAELVRQGFDVSFTVPDSTKALDYAPFETVLPFPAGTTKFLVKKGETILAEVPVSSNAPTLSIKAPKAGEQIDGQYTITWSAQDADAEKLRYDVEYSPNGSEDGYIILATSLAEPKWTENFADLPGGEHAVVRVTATDGVNAVEATSDPFKVALKVPEVMIDDGNDKGSFVVGDELVFSGSAYDHQGDDWLVDDGALTWSSDKDGVLGSGELVYVDNLSVGRHVITLTAKNAAGLTASASETITIGERKGSAPQIAPVAEAASVATPLSNPRSTPGATQPAKSSASPCGSTGMILPLATVGLVGVCLRRRGQ